MSRIRAVGIECLVVFATLVAVLTFASPSRADQVLSFTGSGNDGGQGSGTNLSALVTFDLNGTNLQVTLQNTTANSEAGNYQNADILTAVVWKSTATFTPLSAAPSATSTVVNTGGTVKDPPPLGANWAYATGAATYNGVAINQGIGSTGVYNFGSGNFDPPIPPGTSNPVDGSDWGIISNSDTSPSDGALNTSPFVRDAVVFNLTLASGTNLNDLTDVDFQFGTSSSEPSFTGTPSGGPPPFVTPEPPASLLFALGFGAIGVCYRARRKPAPIAA